jgi:uncharacterized OsmC-like protein
MPDVHIREALERAKGLFAERPTAARKSNASATAVLIEGLRCDIRGPEGEHATSDMPKPMGGEGSGPNPGWYFRASMASCTATAIAMQAAVQGITLARLEVAVHSESDARGLFGMGDVSAALSNLRMEVTISAPGAPAQQLEQLIAWAEAHSPVSCTLRSNPVVALQIQVV